MLAVVTRVENRDLFQVWHTIDPCKNKDAVAILYHRDDFGSKEKELHADDAALLMFLFRCLEELWRGDFFIFFLPALSCVHSMLQWYNFIYTT